MSGLRQEDQTVIAAVAAAAHEIDPVPPGVIAAAQASLAWLDVDAELAELVEDSGRVAAGVRSQTASRLLVFTAGSVEINVEVTGADDGRRLVGQITPPSSGTLEVRHVSSEKPTVVAVDEFGRFIADRVPTGLVSLRCTLADDTKRTTSWVRI